MGFLEDLLEGGRRRGRHDKHYRKDRGEGYDREGPLGLGADDRARGYGRGYGHGHGHGDFDLAMLKPALDTLLRNKALLALAAALLIGVLGLALWLAALVLGQVNKVGIKGILGGAQPVLQRVWEGSGK